MWYLKHLKYIKRFWRVRDEIKGRWNFTFRGESLNGYCIYLPHSVIKSRSPDLQWWVKFHVFYTKAFLPVFYILKLFNALLNYDSLYIASHIKLLTLDIMREQFINCDILYFCIWLCLEWHCFTRNLGQFF